MNKLWLVGQVTLAFWNLRDEKWDSPACWEAVGIFESEELAVAACRDKNYFVMPLNLNEQLAHESVDIEDSYYPLEKKT